MRFHVALDPGVVVSLFCSDALLVVVGQHLFDKGFRGIGYSSPVFFMKLPLSHLNEHLCDPRILSIKRQVTAEQSVHDNPAGPNVALFGVFSPEDFRCRVMRSAEECREVLVFEQPARGAEVDDLQSRVFCVRVKHKVF